jgi:hypothetical protein
MSRSYIKHGLITLERQQKERRSGPFDNRTKAAQNARKVQQGLIADMGGADHISTAAMVLIEITARDIAYLDETDRRIFKTIKEYPKAKASPKFLAMLYSYRQPIITNISKNLLALGLDKKPPPQKTLEELLNEPDDSEQPANGEDKPEAQQ